MIPLEFRQDFWHQKSTVPGLSYGIVCMIPNFVLVQCQLVTDRQTHDNSKYVPCYRNVMQAKTTPFIRVRKSIQSVDTLHSSDVQGFPWTSFLNTAKSVVSTINWLAKSSCCWVLNCSLYHTYTSLSQLLCRLTVLNFLTIQDVANKYVSPPYCRTEMYAGHITCCPLVTHGEYANGKDRQTDCCQTIILCFLLDAANTISSIMNFNISV